MKLLAVLALAAVSSLVWFLFLVLHGADITYDAGFETECRSLARPGVDGTLPETGLGAGRTEIVSGQGVYDDLQVAAREAGVGDPTFLDAALDQDCADRRSRTLVWAVVASNACTLSAAGAAGTARRTGLPRRRREDGGAAAPRLSWR